MPTGALDVADVHFTYPGRGRRPAHVALRGVTLRVEPGEAVAMLGPNGSGKSTLVRIVCGLLPAQAGTVRICGAAPAEGRRHLGVVFQHDALDPHLTVDENLRDQGSFFGLRPDEARATLDAELEAAGLADRRGALVKTLSGGLRRRVDLCRALIARPALLVLDEPTVGLDPPAREAFLESLEARRRASGLSVLMSTHLVDEAERHDRVVLLDRGAIVADDGPAALRRGLGERRITVEDPVWTPAAADADAWSRTPRGWRRYLGGDADHTAALVTALAAGGVSFSVAPPDLGDVFEHATGRALEPEGAIDAEEDEEEVPS